MTEKPCNEHSPKNSINIDELKTLLRNHLSDDVTQNAAQKNNVNSSPSTVTTSTWREFMPVYIAVGSLLISTFITYSDMKTQVATLEVKLGIISQQVTELKQELRNEQAKR